MAGPLSQFVEHTINDISTPGSCIGCFFQHRRGAGDLTIDLFCSCACVAIISLCSSMNLYIQAYMPCPQCRSTGLHILSVIRVNSLMDADQGCGHLRAL